MTAYIVVYGGTENNTDAAYCLTLDDARAEVQQHLDDYGPEAAAELEIYEVGERVPMVVESTVVI